ncbi:MAG: rRNA pseudouridine synthase [Defluviitaleaceae bacterium]|nr:rRNA pseudouridine synthase [Defluviitaleaceae bacterium]
MLIRLQKWISQSGVASRRKAEELILAGEVTVNGTVVTTLGTLADTDIDIVMAQGVECRLDHKKVYIALHKPEGVVTTTSDPYNRATVMNYVPGGIGIYPVGRLDYDTSGLILLTNDGAFAQHLAHPRHEVSKVYIATVKGMPDREALERFRSGLVIEGRLTSSCDIEVIKKEPNARVRIRLREGRNRQVRKMCEAIGHRILALKRVEVGHVKLGGLPRGEWRHLTSAEVKGFAASSN